MNLRVAALLLFQTVLPAAAARAGSIDVIFYDNRFGTVDSSTGAYTQISTLPLSESAGIAAGPGDFYVEDMNSNLLTVDPLTGAATLVGSSGLNLAALVFGGGSNGLFEIDASSNLYAISSTTGKATLIGATGLSSNLQSWADTSLSDDGTSLLLTVGKPGAGDELYRINIATGVATDLGNTGVTGVAGSAFINGYLDLFQYNQPTDRIYSAPDGSLDFTPGAALGAQIIDGGATLLTTDNAEAPSTPEPGTLLLAASAITLDLWRRRFRRPAPFSGGTSAD
jgi:hypothetical protein